MGSLFHMLIKVACTTPCSHRRGMRIAVPGHTDFITAQLIGPAEVAGYFVPHGHEGVERLFV